MLTRSIPLDFAKALSSAANDSLAAGEIYNHVSAATATLLRHWFDDCIAGYRELNFHEGQKQAILNTIYVNEVLQAKNVAEMYQPIAPEKFKELQLSDDEWEKYRIPKYCMRMATGTGKTWVMHALLIWQYLNNNSNFLLVAPGLIVYDRLLDAYCGKEQSDGSRDFTTSDIYKYRELFIPDEYREQVLAFVRHSVAKKKDIGTKTTAGGIIAVTNWHLLNVKEKNLLDEENTFLRLPMGKKAPLEDLDRRYFRGGELDYLTDLPNLVVFNDEAHHLSDYDDKLLREEENARKKWQLLLDKITAADNGKTRMQIDFSATPYSMASEKKIWKRQRTAFKNFFPHIVVDFDLPAAMHRGLVKLVVIDQSDDTRFQDLDYRAERDAKKRVAGLSDGQKTMLEVGLEKLRKLEKSFGKFGKQPKMFVVCEDTEVSPFVVDFLEQDKGMKNEVIRIDTAAKDEDEHWNETKRKLSDIDNRQMPKVIVSVMMLREGFDVNNICVIVPLRTTGSSILLEQIIGRGLRLMWREQEFQEYKDKNRERTLKKNKTLDNYFDVLSIIDHPNFRKFYDEYIEGGLINVVNGMPGGKSMTGGLENEELKADYAEYDLAFPLIVRDRSETLWDRDIPVDKFAPCPKTFAELKDWTVPEFISTPLTKNVIVDRYAVPIGILQCGSYSEFLGKMTGIIQAAFQRDDDDEFLPLQVNVHRLGAAVDKYVCRRLFRDKPDFHPLDEKHWQVLTHQEVYKHIILEGEKIIQSMLDNAAVNEAEVMLRQFSELAPIRVNRNRVVDNIVKSIVKRLPFDSDFEKAFIEYLDADGDVDSFFKIPVHSFARVYYISPHGGFVPYYPDFIVKIADRIYLAETKGDWTVNDATVRAKKQAAAAWCERVNALPAAQRCDAEWHYVLLSDKVFADYCRKSAKSLLDFAGV